MNIDGFIRSSSSFSDFFERAKSLKPKEQGDVFERVVQARSFPIPDRSGRLRSAALRVHTSGE